MWKPLERFGRWLSRKTGTSAVSSRGFSYDAAAPGSSNWRAVNQSGEDADRYDRDAVRARARDLERNSDVFNSIVSAFVRNIVGKGFILQADTGDTGLDDQIEALWRLWCKKQNCGVTGAQSLNQMLRMAVRRKKIDGGVLLVKRFSRGGILPFRLQLVEVDELDASRLAPRFRGNRVMGGIEYNAALAPAGFWLRQYSFDGVLPLDPVFVPAKDVMFYFSRRRPSQLREMSDMAPSVTRIRDLNEFMISFSMKQRIEACFGIAIRREIPQGGFGRPSAASAAGSKNDYGDKNIFPGMILELNPGDSIETINPNGQSTDASAYAKLLLRMISAGQGLSYEAASRDMSQCTYSSARQGMIEDAMTYAEEEEQVGELLDEIYETFLISAVLAGKVDIPDFWEQKAVYFRHTFEKPPKDWIDPVKEANAAKIAVQTGQKTFKQIAAQNGSDWRKQVDDICDVLDYAMEQHGIDLGGVILGQNTNRERGAEQSAAPDEK